MPALLNYLPTLGHTHFAYVGSVYGAGAWAVAAACAELDYECSLFLSEADYTPPWLSELDKTGAHIYWQEPLPVTTIHKNVTTENPHLYNLPLGFDTPEFIQEMSDVLRASVPSAPPEIWVSALSGVMARSACLAFPDSLVHAVSAVKHAGDLGRAQPHPATEKYHKPALCPPPYPSCPFSDAKLWEFARKSAVSGAYILNVSS